MKILQGYRQQIASGRVTLDQLAKTESDCSSAAKGGDLGWFASGQMQPAFEQATKALKVGELSQPVTSDSGILSLTQRFTRCRHSLDSANRVI